jgi:hypothetical protein
MRSIATCMGIIQNMCRDWAEDHTRLQEIALQCGVSQEEVDGDAHVVPDIVRLAEMAVERLKEQVLDKKGHVFDGDYVLVDGDLMIHERTGKQLVAKRK